MNNPDLFKVAEVMDVLQLVISSAPTITLFGLGEIRVDVQLGWS